MKQNTLKPTSDFKIYRRNLPHIEVAGSFYFVTFRTALGVFLSDPAKDVVLQAVKFHDNNKYELHACAVMETHVHIVLQPLSAQARTPVPQETQSSVYSLAQIMHSIKSYSSKRVKPILKVKEGVWVAETFDRIIRSDEDYDETMNYVIYNPVKAGLVGTTEEYRWVYVRDRN